MKSLYSLCEYGITKYVVDKLNEKGITVNDIKYNFDEALSLMGIQKSEKISSIKRIIAENPSIFEKRSLYELYEYGLSQNIIEKLLKNEDITLEELLEYSLDDIKNIFCLGNNTSEKIYIAINKYKSFLGNDVEEDEQKYIESKIITDCIRKIKQITEYKVINHNEIINILKLQDDLPVDFDCAKILNNEKIVHYPNGIRYKFPKLEEILENNVEKKNVNILKNRLSGKTLEEVAHDFGITRERVRQITSKMCKKIDVVKEDIYKSVFEEFKFREEEFSLIFDEDKYVFYFLKEKYRQGEKSIFDYINENEIEDEKKNKIYKKYNLIDVYGEKIPKTRLNIINVYLSKLTELKSIDLICGELNYIFKKYNLPIYEKRNLEAFIDRNEHVISSINRQYRFFDYEKINNRAKEKINNMFEIEDGFYSTLMIFNNYKEYFLEIGIEDEYELHNFAKKVLGDNENILFKRTPNFIIGNIDRDEFILKKMNEYSPIHLEDFLNILEEEYGHKIASLRSYIQKEFSSLINNNVIITKVKEMDNSKIQIIESKLNENIYTIHEFEAIIENVLGNEYKEYINSVNISKLGYKFSRNYVIRGNQNTVVEALKQRIINYDFYKPNFTSFNSTYYVVLRELEKNLDIVKFDNENYITIRKLKEVGIEKKDLLNFRQSVIEKIEEESFFTVKNLFADFNIIDFEEFGFEDEFYESLLAGIEDIKKIKISGRKIFCFSKSNISKVRFLENLFEKIRFIDIYKLMELLKEKYDVFISKEDLLIIVHESKKLYYNKILEKVFADKETYYEEVYKNESREFI